MIVYDGGERQDDPTKNDPLFTLQQINLIFNHS